MKSIEGSSTPDGIVDVFDHICPEYPAEWRCVKTYVNGFAAAFRNMESGLLAMLSCVKKSDERFWIHCSVSHADHIPTYMELIEVKNVFIGDDRKAIMVFPRKEVHVNLHPNCLHLFTCVSDDGLPEFAFQTPSGEWMI